MATSDLPLEAYKMLGGMIQSEEKLLWERTQVFLAINGAMVTALEFIRPATGSAGEGQAANTGTSKEFLLAVCIVGAIASLLWIFTILRSEAFYNHWFEQLKYLERQYLDPIKTFQFADDFFRKGEVMLGTQKLTLPLAVKVIRIYQALLIASVISLAIWIFILLYNFL